MPYVDKQPIRFDSCPSAIAASMPGVPHAVATDRKAVYIAPMCAAPLANR